MTIKKYLNPRNDIAFKKIFGTEKNKDILMHFLNDIIVPENAPKIKKVTLLNPSQYPEIASKKQSIVDVLCEDENKVQYIVEMQVAPVSGFEKRAQYYAAKAYASQPNKGERYDKLKEVVFLAITEYVMFAKKKDYKSVHVILDQESYERDLRDFSFTFIELPKFKKELHELKSYEDKWCYFFKHADDVDNISEILHGNDEIIKKAYHALEAHNWTNEELRAYEACEKANMDAMAREDYIIHEATAKGMQQGIQQGMQQGIEKGKAEGMQQGMEKGIEVGKAEGLVEGIEVGKKEGVLEGKLETAKMMLKKGFSIEDITAITGLPLEKIRELID